MGTRRWYGRAKLLLESETIDFMVGDSTKLKLNGLRILTTNDTSTGPPGPTGPTGPPGANGVPTTLGIIGALPNVNGGSLSGSTFNLQPANNTFGGVVTTLDQTFSGRKTFSGKSFLIGTINNLPPDPGSGLDNRVVTINGTTGELSCQPFYVDTGLMTLNTGTITSATFSNPPPCNLYGIFSGNIAHLTIQPSNFQNILVTGITGSPTICDLTGPTSLPFIITPAGDVTFISPFINNGVFTSAKWTVTTTGKIKVELFPSAVFTVPFGLGTNSVTLSYTFSKD